MVDMLICLILMKSSSRIPRVYTLFKLLLFYYYFWCYYCVFFIATCSAKALFIKINVLVIFLFHLIVGFNLNCQYTLQCYNYFITKFILCCCGLTIWRNTLFIITNNLLLFYSFLIYFAFYLNTGGLWPLYYY